MLEDRVLINTLLEMSIIVYQYNVSCDLCTLYIRLYRGYDMLADRVLINTLLEMSIIVYQ